MALDLLRGAAERANALRAGVILIGGSSTRMGTDKSALMLDGQTLLERTIAAISPLVGEILIVGKPGVSLPINTGNTGNADNTANADNTDGRSANTGGSAHNAHNADNADNTDGRSANADGRAGSKPDSGHAGNEFKGSSINTARNMTTAAQSRSAGTFGSSTSALGLKPGVDLGALLGNLGGPATQSKPVLDGASRGLEHAAQTASLTIRRVADRWPGEGPLGGILSAFASTTALEILVVAVDHPWLSVDSLRALCATPMTVDDQTSNEPGAPAKASPKGAKQRTEQRAADCVMTLHQSRLQPLHARYTRRCESLMSAQFATGERSIVRCNLLIGEHLAEESDRSSVDVDTPEEWQSITNC